MEQKVEALRLRNSFKQPLCQAPCNPAEGGLPKCSKVYANNSIKIGGQDLGAYGGHSSFMPPEDTDEPQHELGGIIRDVWQDNLEEEFQKIIQLVDKYNYVAMDTEFPGFVVVPRNWVSRPDYNYRKLFGNVNMLKIIQLGLTFADADGNLPPECSTWQFNFEFDLRYDTYAEDSIEMLRKAGIKFDGHQRKGINVEDFGALLMTSNIVLNDNVKWITFHAGFDFGYLTKLITNANLPESETEFFELVRGFFPMIYDLKYLMKQLRNWEGSLNKLAEELDIRRVGPCHQAGSDSLVTSKCLFGIMAQQGERVIEHINVLYGLGQGFFENHRGLPVNSTSGKSSAEAIGNAPRPQLSKDFTSPPFGATHNPSLPGSGIVPNYTEQPA